MEIHTHTRRTAPRSASFDQKLCRKPSPRIPLFPQVAKRPTYGRMRHSNEPLPTFLLYFSVHQLIDSVLHGIFETLAHHGYASLAGNLESVLHLIGFLAVGYFWGPALWNLLGRLRVGRERKERQRSRKKRPRR